MKFILVKIKYKKNKKIKMNFEKKAEREVNIDILFIIMMIKTS